jgi:hypothetical protein
VQVGRTQQIARTVAAAESEGASFTHGAPPAAIAGVFGRPFGGTAERRCVVTPDNAHAVDGSLRSGEMIVRAGWSGTTGFEANKERKILWMPIHNPFTDHLTKLVIRASRIGSENDSLRLVIAPAAKSSTSSNKGFPSLVSFPAAGTWLVVATAGDDWGCFEFSVES